MNKKIKVIIPILIGILCLLGIGYKFVIMHQGEKHLTDKLDVSVSTPTLFELYNLEGTYFTSLEDTEELASDYLYQIGFVIDDPYWWESINPTATKIYLDLSFGNSGRSLTEAKASKCGDDALNGGIYLATGDSQYIMTDGALPHEMVHMIGYMGDFSISLDEGFCEWVKWQVSKSSDYLKKPEWAYQDYYIGSSIYLLKEKNAMSMFDEIYPYVGNAQTGYVFGQGFDLGWWYECSHSFVTYLIDQYGLEKVKTLIKSGTSEDSYMDILGISYDQVKSDWKKYLFNYESPISFQEIVDYQKMMMNN